MATTIASTTSTIGSLTSTLGLGVGSSLDLSSLLESMQAVEEQKLTVISNKQTAYQDKSDAYEALQTALETYSTATAKLTDSDLFNAKKTSTNTAFTTEVSSSATSGSYSVNVTQLATAQTLVTETQDSKTTQLGTSGLSDRTLSITVGTGSAVSISLTDDQTTLTGIASAINSANAGVTASIVQSGDSSYQLTITSNETGEANTIAISSNDSALESILGDTSTTRTESVAAQNAKLTVNGVAIERSSNTVTDVPAEGVTLTLTSTSSAAETLTISKSITDATSAIKAWATAYNTLQTAFTTLSDPEQDTGVLSGDSVLRSVKNQLKSLLSTAQSSDTFKVVNELGITLKSDGTLSVNDTDLINTLTENSSAVSDFFVGDGKTTGLATQMVAKVDTFTATKGTIAQAKEDITDMLSNLSKQYTKVQTSIESTMARYKTQFVKLDVLMSEMSTLSTYLTNQFEALTSSSNS
ncbi:MULTISPECIES: flagellar filament capping protein FliD [unclassified Brenneria]|uniref:flagellar filament capping protein FliD n=1 Tax=unclassified Brenneria TaxID=2634434 RepID=UPI00155772F4|nr:MULTISPECIES: flagellar filament capping protein FliD [unclassified Brenneria]MBJ7220432.1 flagellar filament capping protein FliD [Brenneria sp. L3-3C-1]MEE3641676.1 flagellar filament capping protein FliD [Brenneria sp. L3_3C_1]MEE3649693.1 flagellar filament capping protein FliD [Brenneria sp. HEZEL_4_2_4]NPC99651.1 flagellar filament capping protein FliD [Brenneria sp. hezel4-2-4]